MATSFSSSPALPPVAIFVPQDHVLAFLAFAETSKIGVTRDTFQTKADLAETSKERTNFDKEQSTPNPLTDLFAQKIRSAFDLGHETLKSVLDSSLKVAAIFGTVRAIKALRPLASIAANKLPGYITKLNPAIPGADMLKFLGLFFIVKAALQPLLGKILANNPIEMKMENPLYAPTSNSRHIRQNRQAGEPSDEETVKVLDFHSVSSSTPTNNFKRNAICFLTPLLLTFLVKKQIGLEISSVSKVFAVALGYPLVQLIEKAVSLHFTEAHETYHSHRTKDPISYFLFDYLPR